MLWLVLIGQPSIIGGRKVIKYFDYSKNLNWAEVRSMLKPEKVVTWSGSKLCLITFIYCDKCVETWKGCDLIRFKIKLTMFIFCDY